MLRKYFTALSVLSLYFLFTGCMENPTNNKSGVAKKSIPVRQMPARTDITYKFMSGKDSSIKNYSGTELAALMFLNRCDEVNLKGKDSVIVPVTFADNIIHYSPFPFHVKGLGEVNKIVFFSYPAQVFAAYENGYLVHTGPTNMGREKDQTPTGLFFANWKAEKTTSTFNDEWELKWNFNIQNKEGVGWHQYVMPGYPASHSCLRMLEADAKTMYEWADQWELEGTDNIKAQGTPVIVFGAYPFGQPKPWMALVANAHALDITEDALMQEVQPHLQRIMDEQAKREALGK